MKTQAENKKREPAENKALRPLEPIKVLHVNTDLDPAWKETGLWKLVMPMEEEAHG